MSTRERKILKYNAELVDVVFRLMFDLLWVSPYDRRRNNPLLVVFERRARQVSVLLGKVDLATASCEQLSELRTIVLALDQSVGQICEARLFPLDECTEALGLIAQFNDALSEAIGVETPNR